MTAWVTRDLTIIVRSSGGTVQASLGPIDEDEFLTLVKIASAVNLRSDQAGQPVIAFVRTDHAFADAMAQGALDWDPPHITRGDE